MLRYKSISDMAWLYGEQIYKKKNLYKVLVPPEEKRLITGRLITGYQSHREINMVGIYDFLQFYIKKHLLCVPTPYVCMENCGKLPFHH